MLLLNTVDADIVDDAYWDTNDYRYNFKEIDLYKKHDCYREETIIANTREFLKIHSSGCPEKILDSFHKVVLTDKDGVSHYGILSISYKNFSYHINVDDETETHDVEFTINIALEKLHRDRAFEYRWKIPVLTGNTATCIYLNIYNKNIDLDFIDEAVKKLIPISSNTTSLKRFGIGLWREMIDLLRYGCAIIERGYRMLSDRPIKYCKPHWSIYPNRMLFGRMFDNDICDFELSHFLDVCHDVIKTHVGDVQMEISDNGVYPLTLTNRLGYQYNGHIRLSELKPCMSGKMIDDMFFVDLTYSTPNLDEWTKRHNHYSLSIKVESVYIDEATREMLEDFDREIIEGYGRHKTPKELRFIDFEDPEYIEV